ncbi:hypothetical protein BASA81_001572 [Batrachochytrium salamandrivorans]|nr:hypothetical protein BASA81_001572 [Batrachochytrium salamandrivorans]
MTDADRQRWEEKLQAATGLVIGAYTAVHLANHFGMHLGADVHQAMFRRIHRFVTGNRPVEGALLLSILVHSVLSVKRCKGVAPGGSRLLHQAAGWFLLVSLPGHVYFTRVAGGERLLPPGQELSVAYAATTSRVAPWLYVPYYAVLSACGAVHAFSGLARAGRILDLPLITNNVPFTGPAFWNTCKALALAAASSSLAVSGVYFRYPIANEQLFIDAVMSKLPPAIAKRISFPDHAWFAKFT